MKIHPRLRELLIEGGITGLKQSEIIVSLRNTMKAPEIREILEEWRKEGYVQRFRLSPKTAGRPITVWRATNKILEMKDEEKT